MVDVVDHSLLPGEHNRHGRLLVGQPGRHPFADLALGGEGADLTFEAGLFGGQQVDLATFLAS